MKQFGRKLKGVQYVQRPGAYAVIFNASGEIAVIKMPTGYFLPGGGVEDGESVEVALEREIEEEIGMRVRILGPLGRAAQWLYSAHEHRSLNKIGTFFFAEIEEGSGNSEKDHELVWLTPENAILCLKHEFQKWAVEMAVGIREKK